MPNISRVPEYLSSQFIKREEIKQAYHKKFTDAEYFSFHDCYSGEKAPPGGGGGGYSLISAI